MRISVWIVMVAVTVLAPWLGHAQTLPLSMNQAVELALEPEGSVRIELAREFVRQARSRSVQARSALLPNIDSSVGQQSVTRNLSAFGIQFDVPIQDFEFPSKTGPYNVFDARATISQSVFNLSSIRRYQASRSAVKAAKAEGESTQDQVAFQVAKAYLAALRSEAKLEAANANVELAEALLRLAANQKDVGTGTGIDVTRARVQLSDQRQLLLVAENQRRRAHLELLRAMDLKLDTELELTGKLEYHPTEPPEVQEALETALTSRGDWRAQQGREASARLSHSAGKWERLPSVAAFGDYGTIGNGIGDSFSTRTYGVQLRVPVFDGGRMDAQRAEAGSALRQERIRSADLRARIELEIRLALDNLCSAAEQVAVAEEGLKLAENELEQAQRRFRGGVTNSIEVTDAQSRLARARDNRIAALFSYESARLDLGQAIGTIQNMISGS